MVFDGQIIDKIPDGPVPPVLLIHIDPAVFADPLHGFPVTEVGSDMPLLTDNNDKIPMFWLLKFSRCIATGYFDMGFRVCRSLEEASEWI